MEVLRVLIFLVDSLSIEVGASHLAARQKGESQLMKVTSGPQGSLGRGEHVLKPEKMAYTPVPVSSIFPMAWSWRCFYSTVHALCFPVDVSY